VNWGWAGDGDACGGEYGRGGTCWNCCCGCAMMSASIIPSLHWFKKQAQRPPSSKKLDPCVRKDCVHLDLVDALSILRS
jgi:hypothetical protein